MLLILKSQKFFDLVLNFSAYRYADSALSRLPNIKYYRVLL